MSEGARRPAAGAGTNRAGDPSVDRPEVVVVRTGTANLASMLAGLRRAGAEPRLCDDPGEVAAAPRAVLPGVGSFAAAMEHLAARRLDEAFRERVRASRASLFVCLGLQVLLEESEESPGVRGLGLVPGRAERFRGDALKIPQLGWNRVEPDEGCAYLRPGFAYYANSYRLETAPPDWRAARTDYGGTFVAAIERGPLLACQFHPELSGTWGEELLRRWLAGPAGEVEAAGAAGEAADAAREARRRC
jgi:imidazole glycerol phosphate synthase glutamine amidotransferase subunit